jgi:hypothetical protein
MKLRFRRDQTDHQKTFPGKIEEVTGVDKHGQSLQERDGEIVIGSCNRDSQDGVPAAFAFETREGF